MLRLEINGQNVDLGSDFAITINGRSPIFSDQGSFSFPFTLPPTPRNLEITGNRHRPGNAIDPRIPLSGKFYWGTIPLHFGTIKINPASRKSISAVFYCEGGDFYFNSKNKYIDKMDFGSYDFDSWDDAMDFANSTLNDYYPTYPVTFPMIYNDLFYDNPFNYEYWKYYNLIARENDFTLQHSFSEPGIQTILVPFVYLRHILKELFPILNFSFTDHFFSNDTELSRLLIYSSFDINHHQQGDIFPIALEHWRLNHFLPHEKVLLFLKGLQDWFNVRFFINGINSSCDLKSVQEVLKSHDIIDFSKNILDHLELEFDDSTFENIILKSTADPGDSKYQDAIAIETQILNRIKGRVETVDELQYIGSPNIGDIYYVVDEHTFYIYGNEYPWQWEQDDDFLEEIISMFSLSDYKSSDFQIETTFSTLLTVKGIPHLPTCGNTYADHSSITPRLVFADLVEREPQGNYKIGAKVQLNDNSLLWSGRTGIFEKHYKEYLEWYANKRRLLRLKKIMKPSDIINLDYSKKYMIFNHTYLLKEYKLQLRRDSILPADMEFYLVD